ncbi:uncharacterized protein IWZ02DRAFT_464044 [Phyllosticta citriasiana]|uniref:uncharacterized protein n=1 Tax=Phyllosticta citriasiana TaxID=595635 RepID=UPI0030FD4057
MGASLHCLAAWGLFRRNPFWSVSRSALLCCPASVWGASFEVKLNVASAGQKQRDIKRWTTTDLTMKKLFRHP